MIRRVLALLLATAAVVSAQSGTRRATNLAALLAHPTFYHQRPITVVGSVTLETNGVYTISADGLTMKMVSRTSAPDGLDEIRGDFLDIGRMNADDPRVRTLDLKRYFNIDPEGPWPKAGEVFAIVASSVTAATPPAAPSVRNLVLFPSRYLDQDVTLVGQFSGRNLLGDLADAPAVSRYDFALRTADAAVWVTNIRPRGRDFELALDTRLDTGRWIEVSGRLQQGRGLQWIDATNGTIRLTTPPRETPQDTRIEVPAAPPPEVVFSAPISDDTDVSPGTTVRIQFSRDIDPATFRTRVAVKYVPAAGEAEPTPDPAFTTQYLPGSRVLEIRFREPLQRFRQVVVQLPATILGTDKQPLVAFELKFETGAS